MEIARSAKFMAFSIKEKLGIENDDPIIRKLMTKFQRRGFSEYLIEMKTKLLKGHYGGEDVNVRPKV